MKSLDLDDVSQYASKEGRTLLARYSLFDMRKLAIANLIDQLALLERQLNVITVEGMRHANCFWEEVHYVLEEDSSAICCIGTRVRLHQGSFEAVWYRNKFVKCPNGGKSRVFSKHIPKPYGKHYRMSQFKGKYDGPFLELVEYIESKYRRLRERAAIISETRRGVKKMVQQAQEGLSHDQIQQLVDEGLLEYRETLKK